MSIVCHSFNRYPAALQKQLWAGNYVTDILSELLLIVVTIYMPSPKASILRAVDAFQVTWWKKVFEGVSQPFVSDTSPKCIDEEGLGPDAVHGLGKLYTTCINTVSLI